MEKMSLEQFISMFGEEVGTELHAQQEAATSGGGSSLPFPLLKKVTDSDLGIGKFGDFVIGTKFSKDKDENGDRLVEDAGVNVGNAFSFTPINVCYRFKKWNEGTKKTEWSNVFKDMAGFKTGVDYHGNPIPDNNVARKELGWKTVKIIAGLVQTDKGAVPALWEVDGKLYFTLGEVMDKMAQKGLYEVINLKTKTEKQGSTKYTIIDVEKTTTKPLDASFWADNKEVVSEITTKMKEYQEANDYRKGKAPASIPEVKPDVEPSDDNW